MLKNINGVLIRFALSILKTLVLDKIQYAPVQEITNGTYNRLKDISAIVTDNDTDNAAQLKAYWETQKRQIALEAVVTAKNIAILEVKPPAGPIIVSLLEEVENELK